jgi:hypothetical protein
MLLLFVAIGRREANYMYIYTCITHTGDYAMEKKKQQQPQYNTIALLKD